MASLRCPNYEECGGVFRLVQMHEWDTNAHWIEIVDQSCDCDLSADQVESLLEEARKLPMEEWSED